jgi:hypothetical protein
MRPQAPGKTETLGVVWPLANGILRGDFTFFLRALLMCDSYKKGLK